MRCSARGCFKLLILSFSVGLIFFWSARAINAQGNTISGTVFGVERRPVADIYVEVRDEFSRSIRRVRTSASGRYSFSGLGSGRFRIAVLPYDLPYQEQEQEVEIINFSHPTSSGSVMTGYNNEIVDVYLRLRKGSVLGPNGTIFAQDVPDRARELYVKALNELDNKNDAAAFASLKAALEIFPKYYLALNRLGSEYIRTRHYEAAAILLALAAEVNPTSYTSWYGLAYSRYSLNALNGAAVAIAKAVEINPLSPEALILSGAIMRQRGKFKESEEQLLKAREVSKNPPPQLHWELALLYGNALKRYSEAASELRAFVRSQPDSKDSEKINKLIAEFERKAAEQK